MDKKDEEGTERNKSAKAESLSPQLLPHGASPLRVSPTMKHQIDRTTSTIASRAQGIHRARVVSWETTASSQEPNNNNNQEKR
ncbi:hypothetical protein NHX12_006528 [Muraenolepis orangiensis]|uniref:Uncharacterized protein n=1 Tax=Muraenolepis orangiensis TaxID=630683 RepID=A0A9Q0DX79_9TELE|nr:hypothetical protein NHX12_006528 [Muraenolepis orangiensis]